MVGSCVVVSADLVPFTVGELCIDARAQYQIQCQQIWFLSPSASALIGYKRIQQ